MCWFTGIYILPLYMSTYIHKCCTLSSHTVHAPLASYMWCVHYMCMCLFVCVCACNVHVFVYLWLNISVCLCTCMCICMCICLCMCNWDSGVINVCVCVYNEYVYAYDWSLKSSLAPHKIMECIEVMANYRWLICWTHELYNLLL